MRFGFLSSWKEDAKGLGNVFGSCPNVSESNSLGWVVFRACRRKGRWRIKSASNGPWLHVWLGSAVRSSFFWLLLSRCWSSCRDDTLTPRLSHHSQRSSIPSHRRRRPPRHPCQSQHPRALLTRLIRLIRPLRPPRRQPPPSPRRARRLCCLRLHPAERPPCCLRPRPAGRPPLTRLHQLFAHQVSRLARRRQRLHQRLRMLVPC